MRPVLFVVFFFIVTTTFSQDSELDSIWRKSFTNRIDQLDQIEGFWSVSFIIRNFQYEELKFKKSYELVSRMLIFRNELSPQEFMGFDIDAKNLFTNMDIEKTAASGIYLCKIRNLLWPGSDYNSRAELQDNTLIFEVTLTPEDTRMALLAHLAKNDESLLKDKDFIDRYLQGRKTKYKFVFYKTFPLDLTTNKKETNSATGFAISSNGIIVTNYHVVENANSIHVLGINNKFNYPVKAKVLLADQKNDIALLQVDDDQFSGINDIPYAIDFQLSDVGEEIFVLGYPLRATMGDEIKLTTGIISSRTGFQGDITSYQISAQVQPGNSGGPVLDKNGNIIAIIVAQHAEANDATYAIKISYLENLLQLLPEKTNVNYQSQLIGRPLVEQIKSVSEFVYTIEVVK